MFLVFVFFRLIIIISLKSILIFVFQWLSKTPFLWDSLIDFLTRIREEKETCPRFLKPEISMGRNFVPTQFIYVLNFLY